MLNNLGNTDVVTSIENEALILVRQTNGNREVEALNTIDGCFSIICRYLVTHIECGLDASLDGETLDRINLSQDGDVDVI